MSDDHELPIPPPARRLTKARAEAYRAALRAWNTRAAVRPILREIAAQTGFYTVAQSTTQFWREMHVGMSCSALMHADAIRLGDDPPDVVLRCQGREIGLEIVDAMPLTRRRGDEFNRLGDLDAAGEPLPLEQYDPDADYATIVPDVERVITSKAAKTSYPPGLVLVVDIHHVVFSPVDWTIERQLVTSAYKGLSRFAEVWLRKGNDILRVSPGGYSRVSDPWPNAEVD